MAYTFSVCALILGIMLTAVDSAKGQSVINKISDESCQCIEKLAQQRSWDLDLSELTGGCVQEAMMNHINEIADVYQIDMNDASAGKTIGEEIGVEVGKVLAKDCPAFLSLMMRTQAQEKEKSLPGKIMEGTLEGKRIDEMVYLDIKDPYGALLSFLWLRKFEGAEQLSGGVDELIGQNVRVRWEEIEYYSPAIEDYIKAREILSIEFYK